MLVPEKSGTLPPTSVPPLTGAAAVGAIVPRSPVRCGISGGVVIVCAGDGTAWVGTPTPPWVRSAPSRA